LRYRARRKEKKVILKKKIEERSRDDLGPGHSGGIRHRDAREGGVRSQERLTKTRENGREGKTTEEIENRFSAYKKVIWRGKLSDKRKVFG